MPKKNAHAARAAAVPDDEFAELAVAVDEGLCRDECGLGAFAEAAALHRPDPPRPSRGSAEPFEDGRSDSGLRRCRRRSCGTRFSPLAGTALEHCRKEFATRVGFASLMRSSVPPGAAAEICRATHRAARERRRRIFATGGGCQGRMALRGRAWIDGAHISGTSLTRGCGEARKRGPSRQEPCIAAAIDVHKSPVAAAIGRGKPPAGRMEDGLQRHIAKGPVIVGGKEKSLNSPAKAVKGVHQTHTADANGPIRLECMPLVNDLCSWLKRCLRRFAGTDPANLQSCLSWYVCPFRVNQARDEWPETERAARHLLMADAYFRSST